MKKKNFYRAGIPNRPESLTSDPQYNYKNRNTPHSIPIYEEETWLDKQDILQLLHISNRTLQRWRKESIIVYCRIRGKIFYPKSKLHDLLNKAIAKTMSIASMMMVMPEEIFGLVG